MVKPPSELPVSASSVDERTGDTTMRELDSSERTLESSVSWIGLRADVGSVGALSVPSVFSVGVADTSGVMTTSEPTNCTPSPRSTGAGVGAGPLDPVVEVIAVAGTGVGGATGGSVTLTVSI